MVCGYLLMLLIVPYYTTTGHNTAAHQHCQFEQTHAQFLQASGSDGAKAAKSWEFDPSRCATFTTPRLRTLLLVVTMQKLPTILPLRPSLPVWNPPRRQESRHHGVEKVKTKVTAKDHIKTRQWKQDTCRSRVEVGFKKKVFKKSLGQLSFTASGTFGSRWAVGACRRVFLGERRQRSGSKGVSKSLM